jgi:hypothetical protein
MKNILTVVLALLVINSFAQNFEGTMKWRMKMEMTDPALKDKMGEAQQMMNDPAMQAQMKQAMEQMNNPQMKTMLDANPQLKAQMEKMMNGGMAGSSFGTNLTMKMRGGNTLTLMEGGMMAGMEILFLKDKNQTYQLDRKNKTWSFMDGKASTQPTQPAVKVTKTSETKKILNYTCTKYVAEITEGGRVINQIFWTTTEMKDFDLKSLAKQRMMGGGNGSLFYEGMEGTPLRIEMATPEGTMVMEALEIAKGTLNESDFTIPADFKEVPGMFSGRY